MKPGRLIGAGALLAVIAVGAAWLLPSDSYLLLPDSAKPLAKLVKVEGEKPHPPGGIYYVDVVIRQASLLEELASFARPDGADLVPKQALVPPGSTFGERLRQNLQQMARDAFPINGTDYIEFYVGNAKQASIFYRSAFGFQLVGYRGPETGVRDRASYLLQQDKIRIVLTSPLGPEGPIAAHVNKHGDGVRDLAFWVDDARDAWKTAVDRGATSVHDPKEFKDEHGTIVVAAIATYGDTIHSLVERRNYKGLFMPGFRAETPALQAKPVGLKYVDHCVGNVELGKMNEWVAFYERVLGFFNLLTFDDKDISTEYSSLMSKVMSNGNGRIKFPINEPAAGKKKSQIEEYLDFYRGPGVQHIAGRDGRHHQDRDGIAIARRRVPRDADVVLREFAGARREDRRAARSARETRHSRGPRRRRVPAADLHEARAGPADAVLRDHSAKGRQELRQGQFQGAVRGHRARTRAAGKSLMPFYHTLGSIPRKRHTVFRRPDGGLYAEELMGHEGFIGNASLLYHVHPPTTVKSARRVAEIRWEADDTTSLRHRHFRTAKAKKGGSATLDRTLLMFNDDIGMLYVEPDKIDAHFYRNSQADEVVYVVEGTGVLETQFGELPYISGDYVVVHRNILHRWRLDAGDGRDQAARVREPRTRAVAQAVSQRVRPVARGRAVQRARHSPSRDARAEGREGRLPGARQAVQRDQRAHARPSSVRCRGLGRLLLPVGSCALPCTMAQAVCWASSRLSPALTPAEARASMNSNTKAGAAPEMAEKAGNRCSGTRLTVPTAANSL